MRRSRRRRTLARSPILIGLLELFVCGCATVDPQRAVVLTTDPKGILRFVRDHDVGDVQVSPAGTYLAIQSGGAVNSAVTFLSTKTKKRVGKLVLGRGQVAMWLTWANERRIIVALGKRDGPLDTPQFSGELMSVDVTASDPRIIFGPRTGRVVGGRSYKTADAAPVWGYLIDPLLDDRDHILVRSEPRGADVGNTVTSVFRVNIYSATKEEIARGPGYTFHYVTDENGRVRAALAATSDGSYRSYMLGHNRIWKPFGDGTTVSPKAIPVSFSTEKNMLYVVDEVREGQMGLIGIDAATHERKELSVHPAVTPRRVLMSLKHGGPVAVRFEPDYSTWRLIDADDPTARMVEDVRRQFPNHRITVHGQTNDASLAIILVSSDRDPGTYYLVDAHNHRMTAVMKTREDLEPSDMHEMRPIKFKARDGLVIHGYLTAPNRRVNHRPPLVIMPRGSPHGTRHYWRFEPIVQMLASQGFAVLQVNFRGSGGYGPTFKEAGLGQWGQAIQNDLIDAIEWVVREQEVAAHRICAVGRSFGGYASLQLAIRAPDLIRCAVGIAGIYDLVRFAAETALPQADWRRQRLRRHLGGDRDALEAGSPARNADKIKAPVLLIHGEEDRTVPIRQARAMCSALRELGKACEALYLKREGHGFRSEQNRLDVYRRVISFLKQQLGT